MAVPRLPKFEPGNGTVFGGLESVPMIKGPQNGSEIRTRFWPRFSHKLALSMFFQAYLPGGCTIFLLKGLFEASAYSFLHRTEKGPWKVQTPKEFSFSPFSTPVFFGAHKPGCTDYCGCLGARKTISKGSLGL